MENDPASWDASNFSVPYSRHVLSEYIVQSQSDLFADRQLRLMIVRGGDGEVVGTIDLTDFSAFHRRGEVGIAIREAHQGHGYAKEALHSLPTMLSVSCASSSLMPTLLLTMLTASLSFRAVVSSNVAF